MLDEIEVRTSQGSLLTLELEDISDGIIVQSIEGLDPVKATIVTSSLASLDGVQYHTSRRESRNLKFRLGLDPDPVTGQVGDVRQRLYGYFMPKSLVGFTFKDSSGLEVDISGRVESMDTPLFTSEPSVDISILCFDSDFVDMTPVVIPGATVSDATTLGIDYEGTVEAGITLDLFVNRDISEFTIYSVSADAILRTMNFAAPMEAGNVLTIVTNPGQKSATLTVGGSPSSILYGVSPQSSWFEMQRGVNDIRVYAEGAPIPYNITYYTRYGGL